MLTFDYDIELELEIDGRSPCKLRTAALVTVKL